jgi:hypothetical protein
MRAALCCSFCRRSDQVVPSLVGGPGVFICGDCVTLADRAIRGEQIPDFAGWDAMSDDDLLISLRPAHHLVEQATDAVGQLVATLRRRSVSWERIGAALGISRQAAWERWASRT